MLTQPLQVVHGVLELLALGVGNQPAAGHLVGLVLVREAFLRKRRREEMGPSVVEAQLPLPLPPPGLGLGPLGPLGGPPPGGPGGGPGAHTDDHEEEKV